MRKIHHVVSGSCVRLTGREGDIQAAAELGGSLYKQFCIVII